MWSGFWFHTSMQSSKNRYIPYNLGLKIVNNKTIWYVTTLFSISSHLFTGKPTMTSSCLPAKWRRRHRACILSCYHYWNQKHWPTLTNHRKAMEMKTNKTRTVSHRLTNTPHPSMSRLFALELGRTKLILPTLTHQGEITPVRVMWPVPNSQRRKFTTWPLISESLIKICWIITKMNPGQGLFCLL